MTEIASGQFTEAVAPRLARRLTCCDACADDLTQETLLRAFRSFGRFDGRHPRAWLATGSESIVAPAAWEPEHVAVDQVLGDRLHGALPDLPETFRAVVDAVDIRGLSYDEAAAALGVPIGTVMSRLHRARRRLRHALGVRGPATLPCATVCA
ncbi:MAG: RNA polymerase sigma factor [Acidimicrobiales bacterium]